MSWVAMNEGLDDPCVNALAISPGYLIDGIVLAATAGGLFRSEDAGETWAAVGAPGSVLSVAVAPPPVSADFDLTLQRTALAGTAHLGVFRSTDAGLTWAPSNAGLAARLLVALAISPDFPRDQTVLSCGLEEGVSRSDDGGVTWTSSTEGLPSLEVAGLAISPAFAQDSVVVAATSAGVAISRDRGLTWMATGGPAPAQAIALAPTHLGIGPLLAGGQDGSLHLSTDSGLTWQMLETPFTGEEIAVVAFSPAYANDRTLFAATSRPTAAGARGRAAVWWSRDDGASWQAVVEERGETRWLSLAVPATFGQDDIFYVGLADRVLRPMRRASESRLGSRRPLWIGEQPGGRRTTVVGVTPSPAYAQDETLFAATSSGVYVSRNAGLSWRPLGEGLTDRSIVAVVLSPAYPDDGLVFAAGLGGTIWRLDDVERRALRDA
jgi:hypothetical protein